jgi:hypothetical protein
VQLLFLELIAQSLGDISLKAGLLFCIFDNEKDQTSLQIFDIPIAILNNILILQIYCSVIYW